MSVLDAIKAKREQKNAAPAAPTFGQRHEQVIRGALGALPGAGATAGAILGLPAGAIVGTPAGGIGAVPGAAAGMAVGAAAGGGSGKALESLGLHLFGLSPQHGVLTKTMNVDPASPAGATLNTVEQMARDAALARITTSASSGTLAADMRKMGKSAAKGTGKAATLAMDVGTLGASWAVRAGWRILRARLNPALAELGIKTELKGTAQMAGKQIERNPLIQEVGASITQKPGLPGTPGRPAYEAAFEPAPAPITPRPLGAEVGQLPGQATPLTGPRYEDVIRSDKLGAIIENERIAAERLLRKMRKPDLGGSYDPAQ